MAFGQPIRGDPRMSEFAEGVLELAVTGIVVIILGTALAPLLPYNVAVIGWILIALAVFAAVVGIAVGLGRLASALGP